MDPATWSKSEMSELERRMLEAARADRAPEALSAQMAKGLGLQAAGAGVGAGLQGGLQGGLFAKAGLWGSLSVAVVAGATSWYAAQPEPTASRTAAPPSTPPAPVAAESVEAPRAAPAAPEAAPQSADAPDVVATVATVAPVAKAEAPSARAKMAAHPPRSPRRDDAALRAEVALLDRVRNALRDDDGARALRLLDQHGRRFAAGTLAPEAAALRIEALVQQGAHERARTMRRQFLETYPTHPMGKRVAELTQGHKAAGSGRGRGSCGSPPCAPVRDLDRGTE